MADLKTYADVDLKTYVHTDINYISSFPREFIALHARYKKGPEYCDKCHIDGCINGVFVTYCLEHIQQGLGQIQGQQGQTQGQQGQQIQGQQIQGQIQGTQIYDIVMDFKEKKELCEGLEIYTCHDLQNYVQRYYSSIVAKPLVLFCEDCDVEIYVQNSSVYLLPLENVRCDKCAAQRLV